MADPHRKNNGRVLKFDGYFYYHAHTRAGVIKHKRGREQRHSHVVMGLLSSSSHRQTHRRLELSRSSNWMESTRLPLTTWNAVTRESLMVPASFPSIPPSVHHLPLHPSVGSPIPKCMSLDCGRKLQYTHRDCRKNMQKTHRKVPWLQGDSDPCDFFNSLLASWMWRVHFFLVVCMQKDIFNLKHVHLKPAAAHNS